MPKGARMPTKSAGTHAPAANSCQAVAVGRRVENAMSNLP